MKISEAYGLLQFDNGLELDLGSPDGDLFIVRGSKDEQTGTPLCKLRSVIRNLAVNAALVGIGEDEIGEEANVIFCDENGKVVKVCCTAADAGAFIHDHFPL